MPEKFGFDQFAWNGATIDRNQRFAMTRAFLVNRGGEQFFAGTRFTFDEDGGRIRSGLFRATDEAFHRVAAMEDIAEFGFFRAKSTAQSFNVLIGATNGVGNEFGGQFERDFDGLYARFFG